MRRGGVWEDGGGRNVCGVGGAKPLFMAWGEGGWKEISNIE